MPAKYWASWASVSMPNVITHQVGRSKGYLFTPSKYQADTKRDRPRCVRIASDGYLIEAEKFRKAAPQASALARLRHSPILKNNVGGGEKGYQNGGEVVPCQGSRSE